MIRKHPHLVPALIRSCYRREVPSKADNDHTVELIRLAPHFVVDLLVHNC